MPAMLSANYISRAAFSAAAAIAVFSALPVISAESAAVATPLRDRPVRITLSLLNELWTAVDAGRRFLASQAGDDGLWRESPNAASAFLEDGKPVARGGTDKLGENAAASVESLLKKPLQDSQWTQLAGLTQFLRAADLRSDLVNRASERLASADLRGLSIGDAASILQARGPTGPYAPKPHEWGVIIAKANEASAPGPGTVALAGLARMARGLDPSGAAVRAHLRWIKRHVGLFSDDDTGVRAIPGTEELRWTAVWLDAVPPAVLHEENFPPDWRMKTAGYLISGQKRIEIDGVSAGIWTRGAADAAQSGFVPEDVAETASAVLTLLFISQ